MSNNAAAPPNPLEWSAHNFRLVAFPVQQGEELMRGERFACAVELDINTAPEFQGPLPQAKLAAVFGELMDAGVQIATHGDVRP